MHRNFPWPSAPSRRRAICSLAASFAASLLLLAACGKEPPPPEVEEPNVAGEEIRFPPNAAPVKRLLTAPVAAAHEQQLTLPGRLAWDENRTARIAAPLAGRISEVLVQPGAVVTANQVLAYLISPDLGTAQGEAARAQADVAQAERSVQRSRDLVADGIVAGKELELAQSELARARADAQRTSARLRSFGASIAVDQRYPLRSPIAGVVVERNANVGTEWRPDQAQPPLFVVTDPTHLWCWIDAPDRTISQLQPVQTVLIRSSAWPDERFEAQVDHISDALDPSTRSLHVRARLANPQRKLKAEMYVSAEFATTAVGTLEVASRAVFLADNAQQVFVQTGPGQYRRRRVVGTAVGEDRTIIASGLQLGERVVVDGGLYLQQLLFSAKRPAVPAASAAPNPRGEK